MNGVGRPTYTKNNPDADLTTVTKALGEEWKAMSEQAKQPFQDKAKKAREEYQVALEKYHQTPEYKKYEEDKQAYKDEQSKKRKRLEGKSSSSAKKAKASKKAAA
eukprot:TRINITY_DN764_c0_g1_i2.p3 TRINITY_DN764_c0_g1~~TRINITY_DN764_c0_g1_i2.p3  ORF type:complete len:105 (+),score=33.71 TRINITY_DN764_c0_g1_i2:368-682(+)